MACAYFGSVGGDREDDEVVVFDASFAYDRFMLARVGEAALPARVQNDDDRAEVT